MSLSALRNDLRRMVLGVSSMIVDNSILTISFTADLVPHAISSS